MGIRERTYHGSGHRAFHPSPAGISDGLSQMRYLTRRKLTGTAGPPAVNRQRLLNQIGFTQRLVDAVLEFASVEALFRLRAECDVDLAGHVCQVRCGVPSREKRVSASGEGNQNHLFRLKGGVRHERDALAPHALSLQESAGPASVLTVPVVDEMARRGSYLVEP